MCYAIGSPCHSALTVIGISYHIIITVRKTFRIIISVLAAGIRCKLPLSRRNSFVHIRSVCALGHLPPEEGKRRESQNATPAGVVS